MNIIRSPLFNSDRNRKAKLQADYCVGLGEVNAPVPGMEQLHATRGPDPVADDISTMTKAATLIVGGLVVMIFLWAWIQPAADMGGVR